MNPQMNRYQNPFSGQINVPVIPGKMVMNENAITPQDIPMRDYDCDQQPDTGNYAE